MILFRAIAFLLFMALALALVAWQVVNINVDVGESVAPERNGILLLALALPLVEAAIVRFAPRKLRVGLAVAGGLPVLPLTALAAAGISAIQARGGEHRRTWEVALLIGALIGVNVLLPLAICDGLVGGSPGLALGWMAIKVQFFLAADYFLGRALLHYFGSAASAFVSLRYLRKRVISLLSVLGIGVGVAVLILVRSVMSGFQTDFKQQVRGSMSHVLVRFDGDRFHLDTDNKDAARAQWAEYVRRIEADPAVNTAWQAEVNAALARFRDANKDKDGLPDAAEWLKSQPPIEGPKQPAGPDARHTPAENDFLVRLRTGGLDGPEREYLHDGDKPATARDFYLTRIPEDERARVTAEADQAWYGPLFRARLQREFDVTGDTLRKHTDPKGDPDVLGVSWRVSTKTFITPRQGNRELPFAELVGVDAARETEISDLGRYVAAAEVNVFKNQYVLRPLLNILGATLGWETAESIEAAGAKFPPLVFTEDGKGVSRGGDDDPGFSRVPSDFLRTLQMRGLVSGTGSVRWPSFDRVGFQDYSPGTRIYGRVREAYKDATRTDDFGQLLEIAASCERDVRALLLPPLEGPAPTEPSLQAARTGCMIIFNEYLTGLGRVHSVIKGAYLDNTSVVKERLANKDLALDDAERAMLSRLRQDVEAATKQADRAANNRQAREAEREDALAAMLKRYAELLDAAHRAAEREHWQCAAMLRDMAAILRGSATASPLSDALKRNRPVPLAFAVERFDAGARYAQRRMEAYGKVLPLRTSLGPDESIDEYLKRAVEQGRRPGDGVRDQGPEPGIIIGDTLAESPMLGGVNVGDVIEVTIPRVYFRNGRPDGQASQVKFRVTALFHSGLYEDNMGRMCCDFDELSGVLADSEVRYYVGARLADYSLYEGAAKADQLKKEIARSLRNAGVGFAGVSVWEDEKRNLLEAVEREKKILELIVGFIIVLVGFLILILVYQLVNEKVKDIGILKAQGFSPWGVRSVFMLNAMFIGLFGALIGAGLGVAGSEYLNEIEDFVERISGVRLFPPDVYFLTYVPSVKGESLLWLALDIAAPVVLFSFGCGIIPALIAAKKDPVEALHYE